MQAARKAVDGSVGAREALKKRGRARRASANSLTVPPFVTDSGTEASRRRLRLTQPVEDACDAKRTVTHTTTSSSENVDTLRPGVMSENCTLDKNDSPRRKENGPQNGTSVTEEGTLRPLQSRRSMSRSGEEGNQPSMKPHNVRQERGAAPSRGCPPVVPVEAPTTGKTQTSLQNSEYSSSTHRAHCSPFETERHKTTNQTPTESQFMQPATPASTGVINTSTSNIPIGVNTGKASPMALDSHKPAPSARHDETGQISSKSLAATRMIQLLLANQLPSCTTSAGSLLESRLRGNLVCSNGACVNGKSVLQHGRVAREEPNPGVNQNDARHISGTKNFTAAASTGVVDNGITCCSSDASKLHTHAPPPPYYTVLTGNGMHMKQDTAGGVVCLDEEADQEYYPVVKGVSRDNTKKRWAVYWKGSRKYFYDKCYADCHQAYLSAVEFRRQAKACNAPGPGPKKAALQSEFYLATPPSSYRFTSYSPALATLPLGPSTSPAFPACEATPPCAAVMRKCSPAAIPLSTALPEHQICGPPRHSDLFMALKDKDTRRSHSDPDACMSSPTTADSCDSFPDTLQVYRCAVIILLQDLLYEVLPSRIIALGSARRTSLHEPSLRAVADERFLSASLLLLQGTLHGHIVKAERAGEEELNQLLTILMPSLDRQLLPSELPRDLQQAMLMQLTTLRL